MLNKYNLDAGLPVSWLRLWFSSKTFIHFHKFQEIAQALLTTQLLSKKRYKEQYEKEQVGSAPHNVTMAYPECEHAKRVSTLVSKVCSSTEVKILKFEFIQLTWKPQKEYVKKGEEIQHNYTMPEDMMELSRAKQSTQNASDVSYTYKKLSSSVLTAEFFVRSNTKSNCMKWMRNTVDSKLWTRRIIHRYNNV